MNTSETASLITFTSSTGSLSSTLFLSKGKIPVARKPDFRLSDDMSTFVTSVFNKRGNWHLSKLVASFPLAVDFQCVKIFRHSFLSGAKKATSNGCKRWVELGGRNMTLMSLSWQSFRTRTDMWLDTLSPIKIFFPSRRRTCGIKSLSTQSSSIHIEPSRFCPIVTCPFWSTQNPHIVHVFRFVHNVRRKYTSWRDATEHQRDAAFGRVHQTLGIPLSPLNYDLFWSRIIRQVSFIIVKNVAIRDTFEFRTEVVIEVIHNRAWDVCSVPLNVCCKSLF